MNLHLCNLQAPFLHHFCTISAPFLHQPSYADVLQIANICQPHCARQTPALAYKYDIYIYIYICVCVCVYIVVCYSASHAIQKSCHTNSTYFSMQQVFHKSNLMSFHLSFFTSFVAKLPSLLGHFATGTLAPCLCTPWCQGSPSQSNGKIHRSLVFDVTRR